LVRVVAGGCERQTGAGHEIADRRRYEQLARRRPFGEANRGLDAWTVDHRPGPRYLGDLQAAPRVAGLSTED